MMPRKIIFNSCIHGKWVANGTHQTSISSPQTLKYLFHHVNNVGILAQKKSLTSVCSQDVTACFMSACSIYLASQVLHTESEEMEITRCKNGTVRSLVYNLQPVVPESVLSPVSSMELIGFHPFGPWYQSKTNA